MELNDVQKRIENINKDLLFLMPYKKIKRKPKFAYRPKRGKWNRKKRTAQGITRQFMWF